MIEQQVSRTAMLMAYVRGYHAMHGSPKIFDDYLAYSLLKEEDRAFFDRQLSPPVQFIQSIDPASAATCHDQASCLAWAMRSLPSTSFTVSRSRYTEDALKEAVKQGVQQYVILGAGMDTFAFRCPEMLEQLQVFEVDHPATQAYKRHRLTELGWEKPLQLHFVAVDLIQESLATVLTRSSYDPQAKSFFSWLGVTMYLTRDEVFASLRDIADVATAGSMVIFDYLDFDTFIPDRVAKRLQVAIENARQWGEPMKAGFDPSMLATELARLGLRLHENLSPSDIQKRYFQGRTDGYYACEHVHFAWAVIE